ncbi:hypothetical protein SELMODRAFT_137451 [Selaginella moellendorffii]|uniref:Pentacotripeptide-repeat region of PRORP domain-containing protein n=3 Tax=Selaginella moellendorffii TaxID=88036 RepID=D8TDR4_SELML|nr:hypothetical protein SELMODRAFT_137451 [Selaginella moellendorffii]
MPARNLVSWTGIISGYAHLGYIDRAKETFDRAPERDVICWNALITAYAMNGYSITALKLLPVMDSDGVEPNAVTFMVLIDACSTLASLADSKMVHSCVRDDSRLLEGDVLLQTSLVNMYGKCGHLDAAREMFDDFPDKCLALWNTMLCVYAQNGHTDQAMDLFQLLLVEGVEPDRITYVGILSAWSHAGVVWYEFLRSLEPDFGVTPPLDFYVCVIDILARTGQLELAEDLIFNMPYEPNEVAWTSLLGACRSYVDRDRAARVAERMNSYNPATYLLLSNLHSLPP